jgi:hypothetical protein
MVLMPTQTTAVRHKCTPGFTWQLLADVMGSGAWRARVRSLLILASSLLVGWWLSALWLIAAWAMGSTIIGLAISFWMVDRVPAILVLTQN